MVTGLFSLFEWNFKQNKYVYACLYNTWFAMNCVIVADPVLHSFSVIFQSHAPCNLNLNVGVL